MHLFKAYPKQICTFTLKRGDFKKTETYKDISLLSLWDNYRHLTTRTASAVSRDSAFSGFSDTYSMIISFSGLPGIFPITALIRIYYLSMIFCCKCYSHLKLAFLDTANPRDTFFPFNISAELVSSSIQL